MNTILSRPLKRTLWLWLALTAVLVWFYIDSSAEWVPGKWWTILEATAKPITYLPYISLSDSDRFYQSLLFQWCLFPSFTNQEISYYDQLCAVTTKDYKTFSVTALPNMFWSDGTPFNLGDVYFTYSSIIQDNYWNIPELENFKNIKVSLVDNKVEVVFPQATIDNMIFFTNFILPQHLLANAPLETYTTTFAAAPVGTSCGRLLVSERDTQSIIYSFEWCSDIPIKFYQVKQLADTPSLLRYAEENKRNITLLMDYYTIDWFTLNPIVLNTYATAFFNTESPKIPLSLRSKLVGWISNSIAQQVRKEISQIGEIPEIPWLPERETPDTQAIWAQHESEYARNWLIEWARIIPDPRLFSMPSVTTLVSWDFVATTQSTQIAVNTNEPTLQFPILPNEIMLSEEENGKVLTYSIPDVIVDKAVILMRFDRVFDRLSVRFNATPEFFPESFDSVGQFTYYNLNPTLRNVAPWRNTYTIVWYRNGVVQATYTLDVRYLQNMTQETQTPPATITKPEPIRIIYGWQDSLSQYTAELLKQTVLAQELEEYFTFEHYPQDEVFAGKLQAKDYDIVLTSLNLWLRRDLSHILLTTDPLLNPSLYTNQTFAARMREYFLAPSQAAKETAKQRIQTNYEQSYPFVLIGKEIGRVMINDKVDFSFPWRLYVMGWRKDFLKELSVYSQYTVNWSQLIDKNHLIQRIIKHLIALPGAWNKRENLYNQAILDEAAQQQNTDPQYLLDQ
jgi:hypothetical protein